VAPPTRKRKKRFLDGCITNAYARVVLDLRRLAALRAVAQYGTISAAARSLHFTAPAVSQQLAALEREAGTALLDRSGRSVRLTDAGTVLAAHAEVLLGQMDAAEAAIATARGARSGSVRIAAFPTAMGTLVAEAIQALAVGEPLIDVRGIEAEPEVALPLLRTDQVDIAVVHHYDLVPRTLPETAVATTILSEPMFVALPADHRRAGSSQIRLGSLRTERWIAPNIGNACYELVQRACGAAGFVPELVVQSTDYGSTLAMVGRGVGVALVPALAVEHVDLAGVVLRPLVTPLHRHIHVLTTARARTAGACAAVADSLAAAGARRYSNSPSGGSMTTTPSR
jgi:DNA-binding transcriptional LysR family regulator